jgi:hypothetical protein
MQHRKHLLKALPYQELKDKQHLYSQGGNGMQVYSSWADVFKSERSTFFSAQASDCLEESPHLSPSQKLMFVQSNARIVLGQSPTGSLAWLAAPSRIYPAPVGLIEPGGIQFYPGMYYQTDILTYLGPLMYKVQVTEGSTASNLQPGE